MTKTIFITGATSGIGQATAALFASHGYRVAVGYHSETTDGEKNKHDAEQVVTSLSGDGHISVACSVDNTPSVEKAFAYIKQQFGTLDVLLNNGGSTKFIAHEDLDSLTDDVIDAMFAIHARGTLACVRAAVPMLNDGGVIVNISSIAAETGVGSNIAYCGAKAAVAVMVKSLARALAPKIRVIGIAPGLLRTNCVNGEGAEVFFEQQAAATPMQRLGTVQEVAMAIYTGVEHLTFTTGRILNIDGGRPLT